jgi:hypothetical protein
VKNKKFTYKEDKERLYEVGDFAPHEEAHLCFCILETLALMRLGRDRLVGGHILNALAWARFRASKTLTSL